MIKKILCFEFFNLFRLIHWYHYGAGKFSCQEVIIKDAKYVSKTKVSAEIFSPNLEEDYKIDLQVAASD